MAAIKAAQLGLRVCAVPIIPSRGTEEYVRLPASRNEVHLEEHV